MNARRTFPTNRTFPLTTFKGGGEGLAFVVEIRPKGFRLAACWIFWMDITCPLWRRWDRRVLRSWRFWMDITFLLCRRWERWILRRWEHLKKCYYSKPKYGLCIWNWFRLRLNSDIWTKKSEHLFFIALYLIEFKEWIVWEKAFSTFELLRFLFDFAKSFFGFLEPAVSATWGRENPEQDNIHINTYFKLVLRHCAGNKICGGSQV